MVRHILSGSTTNSNNNNANNNNNSKISSGIPHMGSEIVVKG